MKFRSFPLLLLLPILCALGAAGPLRATNLTFVGPFTYSIGPSTTYNLTCTQVAMGYGRIENHDNTRSGVLSLELWAVIPNTNQGYKMAMYSDGSSVAGNSYLTANTVTTSLSQPPNGTYGVQLVLKESGVLRGYYNFTQFFNPNEWVTINFGDIYFSGIAAWQQNGSNVTLQIPDVINHSDGGVSKTLRVQLFATSTPYVPNGQLNPAPGPLMASYTYPNTLCGRNFQFPGGTVQVPFTTPPPGTYYSTMILTEDTGAGDRERKDSVNMGNQFTVGAPPATTATPVISPGTNTYQGCVDVTLTTATQGAGIRYTLDGTDPTNASLPYTAPFRLTQTRTVKARAFLTGSADSAVASAVFTVNAATVATPVITPAGNSYTGSVLATITCSTPGAKITYTTNGTTPTVDSTDYSMAPPAPFTTTTTLKAGAFKDCWAVSPVVSSTFTITAQPAVGMPIIDPDGGNFQSSTPVSISVTPSDAVIRYTMDGSVPTVDTTNPNTRTYTASFSLTTSATVMAKAFKTGWLESPLASANFTLPSLQTVVAPVIDPVGGSFASSVNVTLTPVTAGSTIYYTTDTTTPALNGSVPAGTTRIYTDPIPLTTTATVKAIAVKSGWINSPVTSATFTIVTGQVATPVVTPGSGTYSFDVRIRMSCATGGAYITYTDDGVSNPGENSTRYAGPITLRSSKTLRVRAFAPGLTPSSVAVAPITVTYTGTRLPSDCAWAVREISFGLTPVTSLAEAENTVEWNNNVSLYYPSGVINRHDPDSPGGGGFFPGDEPFIWNRDGFDEDEFVLSAQCSIVVDAEDDYTFGFSSDDGARLRIQGATFVSSTRLNGSNPANPAHNGNTLSYPENTGNSDTLGVCHLTPGTYLLDFLTWEHTGGAYCEVFAARGAKTSIDSSFRLVGQIPAAGGDGSRIAAPGWEVVTPVRPSPNFQDALTNLYDWWSNHGPAPVQGLRFTSANDFPERDPMDFVLEGTTFDPVSGPWVLVKTGPTGLSTARLATASAVTFANGTPYSSYRLTFPGTRSASANSMQIAEVQFLDASGTDMTSPGDGVIPSSTNSPVDQTAAHAIDNTINSKYLNFDRVNTGFTVIPATKLLPAINFHDPQSGGGGHGSAQTAFPRDTTADDNNFAIGARATLIIPAAGDYTFCLLGDDGSRFRIKGSHGWTVSSRDPIAQAQALPDGMQVNNCCADAFGTVNLNAGSYQVELIYNEVAGGAYIGLWSAFGRYTSFSPVHFKLLGTNPGTAGAGATPVSLVAPSDLHPPWNDDFINATSLNGFGPHASGCNIGAIMEPNEPAPQSLGASTWWEYNLPNITPQHYQIDTLGSDFNTCMAVYRIDGFPAAFGNLTLIASNDDGGENRTSKIVLLHNQPNQGVWLRIQVGGRNGATGRIRLNIKPIPASPNDDFASAISLGNAPSLSVSGSNAAASLEFGEVLHGDAFDARATVWYSWKPPYSGDFILDTSGSRIGATIAVYYGNSFNELSRIAARPGSYKGTSLLRFSATAGEICHIAVDGSSPARLGDFVLAIVPEPAVTSFDLTPTGSTRTFSLNWRSEPLTTYRIQQSADLTNWSDVTTCFPSTGTESNLDITGIPASTKKRFFRVLRE